MSLEENLEEKIHRTEKKLKEFSITLSRLESDYQQILKDLNITPDQLANFSENPEDYDQAEWEQLQDVKKKLDEKLNLELSRIYDPQKTKKTLSEKGTIQQHWLFVR